MANELRAAATTGQTLYAQLLNASGQRWNGSAFETYTPANYSTYVITMTEQGSSGVYIGSFPSTITSAGSYEYFVYIRAGGSPAEGNAIVTTGIIDWNGSAVSSGATGSMTGPDFLAYVKRKFKRTDKDTELYEAITDSVEELRRIIDTDEAEVQTLVTTPIITYGDYKIPMETDLGLIRGDIVVLNTDNTDSYPIRKVSKEEYDRLYPYPNSTNPITQQPLHFCIFAGYIWLGPVPDKITYFYRINYSKRGGTVSASTTAVPFTSLYREVLMNGVLYKAYAGVENDEQAAKYKALYEEGKKQVVSREDLNREGQRNVKYWGF